MPFPQAIRPELVEKVPRDGGASRERKNRPYIFWTIEQSCVIEAIWPTPLLDPVAPVVLDPVVPVVDVPVAPSVVEAVVPISVLPLAPDVLPLAPELSAVVAEPELADPVVLPVSELLAIELDPVVPDPEPLIELLPELLAVSDPLAELEPVLLDANCWQSERTLACCSELRFFQFCLISASERRVEPLGSVKKALPIAPFQSPGIAVPEEPIVPELPPLLMVEVLVSDPLLSVPDWA